LGAYLALLALAFQLAISFGHVHHIAPTSALASTLVSEQPPSDEANAPSSPAGHADHLCPICTLIHLAGAIVPAETPPLPLPSIFGGLRLEAAVAFDLIASQRALFQARAPPIA
jgi:hypothetical protein